MRPQALKQSLLLCIRGKRPAMIWGKPGVGKSRIVAEIAEEEKVQLIDWRLGQMADVDLRGIPQGTPQGRTRWMPPEELPEKGSGILFLDELPQAVLSTTNAATQLILDRRLGNYRLPAGWVVLAAGNRDEDRAATNRMPTHVANRFIHLSLEAHAGDWLEWAQGKGNIDPRCFAFVKYRPEHLHSFDPTSKEKAFASPRSWEFMSDVMKQVDATKLHWAADEQLELAAGIIGKQVATEFVGFLRIMEKLVSIDEIILHPASAALPTDASVAYALVYALVDRSDRKTFPTITQYIGRLKKEFAFLFFREIDRRKPDLKKTKQFIDWSAKNQDFI